MPSSDDSTKETLINTILLLTRQLAVICLHRQGGDNGTGEATGQQPDDGGRAASAYRQSLPQPYDGTSRFSRVFFDENDDPIGIGDYVQYNVKPGQYKPTATGVIYRTTKCYCYIRNHTGDTVHRMPHKLKLITEEEHHARATRSSSKRRSGGQS